jgi:hypothetical protein
MKESTTLLSRVASCVLSASRTVVSNLSNGLPRLESAPEHKETVASNAEYKMLNGG